MSIDKFYTQTIILLDKNTSTGGYWSTSTGPDYSTAASIKAAVNLLSADEVAAYGKIGFDARYKAYCDVTTEVYGGRRCRWNSDTFDIVTDPKNTLQKNHHYKILLRDVT
jgi:hypothetical protein